MKKSLTISHNTSAPLSSKLHLLQTHQSVRKNYRSIETLRTSHQCSQINCRFYESTSSDSDIQDRIRTKATRFYKAFPKSAILDKQMSSSDTDEATPFIRSEDSNILVNNKKGSVQSKTHSSNNNSSETTKPLSLSDSEVEELSYTADNSVDNRDQYHTMQSKYPKSQIVYRKLTSYSRGNDTVKSSSVHCKDSHRLHSPDVSQLETYNQHVEKCSNINCIQTSYSSISDSSQRDSESDTTKLSKNVAEDPLNLVKNTKESRNFFSKKCTNQLESQIPEITSDGTASKTKHARPFKTYPIDPGFDTVKQTISDGQLENYSQFRRRILGNYRHYSRSDINRNMRRFYAPEASDATYREKRKKNNLAAKRSREARKEKEDELAVRCAYLEQENMFLKKKVAEMQKEKEKLRTQGKK